MPTQIQQLLSLQLRLGVNPNTAAPLVANRSAKAAVGYEERHQGFHLENPPQLMKPITWIP